MAPSRHRRKSRRPPSADPAAPPSTKDRLLIVGIGASAGGLEAFTRVLKHLPVNTGMGFVLVQHLDPAHESALTQILAKATAMPVQEAAHDARVEPNHIYIIPPNMTMTIAQGRLMLQARPQSAGPHRAIDAFFESLAQDRREGAIGVVLSGTASDGTMGMEAIKAEGGITIAQDASAKYDSMPRSAIGAGCVDFVLPPEKIANELARIARHPYVALGAEAAPAAEQSESAEAVAADEAARPRPSRGRGAPQAVEERGFKHILLLVRQKSGVDFSLYKSSTIRRRIARRMVLNRTEELAAYADLLRGNAKEIEALYSDMLISVTGFFRNPDAFDALARKVFPQLLKQRRQDPLRVWVLGCSTGQEAYSIAMAFVECAGDAARLNGLQVFATDLNDALLDKARHGLYAKSLVQDVSPERLRRFFLVEDGGYRVVKGIREMVVFARQNLLSDPPFSRMDLISCRNLLIYLEPSVQNKIIPTFHYALKPDGVLFLGASESVGLFADLFEPLDKKFKIYSKKPVPTPTFRLPVSRSHPSATPEPRPAAAMAGIPPGVPELHAQREADRITVNHYAPPAVLIDAGLRILQFRGPTGPYLELPSGKASLDVLKMARPGLMLPLRAALNKAKRGTTVRTAHVPVQQDGRTRTVNLEVIPLRHVKERCYLIVFEPVETGRRPPRTATKARPAAGRAVQMERELSETRDYLQAVQEQHAAATEELQASNEEVQSANEELQSVNEELETSKDELESSNEELNTLNEELGRQNTELTILNSDLNNLLQSLTKPIVLLARDLTIRRFTRPAERLFNLLATDAGRPLGGIRHPLDLPDLEQIVTDVIETVSLREREVQDHKGRWYLLRITPYKTLDNKIDGAVLMLIDIDPLKRSEQDAKAAREYAEAVIRTTRAPLLVLTHDLRVSTANEAFYRDFRAVPTETAGRLIYELGNGQWNIPRLRELLEDILPRNSFFNDFEVTHDFPHIGRRTMRLNARRLDLEGRSGLILLAIEDMTRHVEAHDTLRASEVRFRRLFESALDGILLLDAVTRRITHANPFIAELLGCRRQEIVGKELWEIGLLQDEPSSHAAFRALQQQGQIRYDRVSFQDREGRRRDVELLASLYREDDHSVIQCHIREVGGQT